MVKSDSLKSIALSLPESTEAPHFERTAFKIRKKIFLTYDEKLHRATLKLSEVDQDVFSAMDKKGIYPVPNKWGKKGWTIVELSSVNEELLKDAIIAAYCAVAPKRLAKAFKP